MWFWIVLIVAIVWAVYLIYLNDKLDEAIREYEDEFGDDK